MTPHAAVLLPEITVESIRDDNAHLGHLFYYYFTNDGVERDRAFVTELIQTGQLEDTDVLQTCRVRQMVVALLFYVAISAASNELFISKGHSEHAFQGY